jgi:carboxyl-terminal processing protease
MKQNALKTLNFLLSHIFDCAIALGLCACGVANTQSPKPTLATVSTPTAVPTRAKPTVTSTVTPTPAPTDIHDEYQQMFETVWGTVNATFFDPNFAGLDWQAVHDRYEPLILAAEDDETFYQLLNQMLWGLKVSHTAVGPAEGWPAVEPVVFEPGAIGIDLRLLIVGATGKEQAVITRLDAGSTAEQAGLRLGYILLSIEAVPVEQIIANAEGRLAPPYNDQGRINFLTNHLLSLIYGDPGTCVILTYLDEKDEMHEGCIERIQRPRETYMAGTPLPPFHLEFESKGLESGVGYIRFNTFYPDLVPEMVQAVAALKDSPGIIIDLRGNPGGDPSVAEQLAAQFMDGQVLFGKFKARPGIMDRLVIGKNVYTGPLVILIDAMSFSASEHFSSGMQALGRAVVIGERTPGGASAANVTVLPNGAIFVYPVAEILAPDGTRLEGYGIKPDIHVDLERNQLLQGIDAQLQAAIDTIIETAR